MGRRIGSLRDVRPALDPEPRGDERIAEQLKNSVPIEPRELATKDGTVKLNAFGELEESDEGQTT